VPLSSLFVFVMTYKPYNNMTKRNDPLKTNLLEALQGYNYPEMNAVDGKTKQKMAKSVKH